MSEKGFGHKKGRSEPDLDTGEEEGLEKTEASDPSDHWFKIIIFLVITLGIGSPIGSYIGRNQNTKQEKRFVRLKLRELPNALSQFKESKNRFPRDWKEFVPQHFSGVVEYDLKPRYFRAVHSLSVTSHIVQLKYQKNKTTICDFEIHAKTPIQWTFDGNDTNCRQLLIELNKPLNS